MPQPALQRYNEIFLRELDRLNPGQREAVDHIEGPVMVIAGPGTGKTHILTARIGRILMETDAQAHNILCLTFTDAGVHAMRERLLQFIGPEAHRVHIYTFHSFCNSIIQDNLELFGRHDLEPLTELERIDIIRKIIDGLEIDHPLRRGRNDPYFYETHLHDLFQRMKSEHWQVDFLGLKIDEYLSDLPNRPEFVYQVTRSNFRKGDIKKEKIDDARQKMERLLAAAALFPRYQEAMQQARRYDYDDMILWVLKAFQENENLLRSYQEKYLYFLIDEYQDTNGAQNEIIRRLIGYWPSPNIFIVGDDDQSIYEFQGARLKNLTDFYRQYQDELRLVLLKENYRSSQNILDSSLALINHNDKRIVNSLQDLGIEKILTARHERFSETGIHPRIVSYPNRAQEEADIFHQIEQLHKEGFPLDEVAIIYAKHRQSHRIITLLEKKGIPYTTRRKVNILDLPLIRNLRALLEYLHAEFSRPHSGEHLLFRILHFRFLEIAPADLARLSVHLASYETGKRPYWRDALRDKNLLDGLGLEKPEALFRFSELESLLLSEYAEFGAPALIERLINRSGLLRYVLEHPAKVWLLQVLKTFFDFTIKESDRNPRLSLKRLLDILDRMDDNRLPIEINKVVIAEQGVNLLTAHSAKGLEFQRVFIIDCVKDHWEPGSRGNSFRFSFPDTLTFSGEEDAMEARRRLFYVAMTRAKELLHISYSLQDDTGKDLQRAIFIDELTSAMGLEARGKEVEEETLIEAQYLQMLEIERPAIPAQERAAVAALLEGFTLSVSALNRFLRCPLSFYYENVLRVPVLVREAAVYGTAMHNALQRLFERMMLSKEKTFPPENELVHLFEYEMLRERTRFSNKEYERRLEMGRHSLAGYYRQNLKQWHKQVKVEFNVRNVEVDGVPLTGTIDKLELLDSAKARIVDYKTGSQTASKLSRPTPKNPHGGNYWRQLVFYKIIAEEFENHIYEVNSGTISYLETDANGSFSEKSIQLAGKDTELVKAMIRDAYARIMDQQFYQGCGEPSCSWCRFVKENAAIDTFSDPEIEELDD
jgi:DNA helicase II / ATP-dependent DNA helicase PcrA